MVITFGSVMVLAGWIAGVSYKAGALTQKVAENTQALRDLNEFGSRGMKQRMDYVDVQIEQLRLSQEKTREIIEYEYYYGGNPKRDYPRR